MRSGTRGGLAQPADSCTGNAGGSGSPLPGETNGDCDVDLDDLSALLASFGLCSGMPGYNPGANFDGDICVSLSDLAILLANFGIVRP